MKVLFLDSNHPLIQEQLAAAGFTIMHDYTGCYDEVLKNISAYDGVIIRSRIPLDSAMLSEAKNLKFIARVGAGMENIDTVTAAERGIRLYNSPEGNRDAVAEQTIGMLLVLLHRLAISAAEVRQNIWRREENRGTELGSLTFGIIGYGNMGRAVAKRLQGFGCPVIFHDIIPGLSDDFAQQVPLSTLQERADIVSLHVPLTPQTHHLVDREFIAAMHKPFYLINTARGKNVCTKDLVEGVASGKILGAALDVLEYESSSFEVLEHTHPDLHFLLQSDRVIVTPHIAGWTHESKIKLAQVIVDKILADFTPR